MSSKEDKSKYMKKIEELLERDRELLIRIGRM